MLRDIKLLNIYDSSEGSIIQRFIIPALSNAILYRRGVGYFSSSWLSIASEGLLPFIEHGGKAEFIVSPFLTEEDWDALCEGEESKNSQVVADHLLLLVGDIRKTMKSDTKNALAWMIYSRVLELRLAIPRKPLTGGMYHDKVGVFLDSDGNSIAFHGSLNDSKHGTLNGEAFTVFRSWDQSQFDYWSEHNKRLGNLWMNKNTQFSAIALPEAILDNIVSMRESDNPPFKIQLKLSNDGFSPRFPKLRPYQESAINAWKEAKYRGIFEMATGTGKTITALGCVKLIYEEYGKVFVVILVPFLHLMDQWAREVRRYLGAPVLCGSSRNNWNEELVSLVDDFNIGAINEAYVIAVALTAANTRFSDIICKLRWSPKILIADEVHSLGSRHLSRCLDARYDMRVGLSATPARWYDKIGTNIIYEYFGNVCYEKTLAKAIDEHFLVPYRYFPKIVHLNSNEEEEYREITKHINQYLQSRKTDDVMNEYLKKLLIRRAKILGNANEKVIILNNLLRNQIESAKGKGEDVKGVLVYCAPGGHKAILKAVSRSGLRCHEFVASTTPDQRQKLLVKFGSGEYQVLVAIKCLDEGVDVPETKIAYICASSTNPREFIQRRGRILRLSEGKVSADIYDFIVMPTTTFIQEDRLGAKSMLRRQLPRFAEFSSSALNTFEARGILWEKVEMLGLIADLDKKPWEIISELVDLMEENDE